MDPVTAVTPPVPVNYTTDSTYYLIYYSSLTGRGCVGSAVAVTGAVIDDEVTLQEADTGSCAADTSCLLDATSSQCAGVTDGLVSTAEIVVSYREDGSSLVLCDTSNPDADQDTCVINPPICDGSSIYPSCTYFLVTGDGADRCAGRPSERQPPRRGRRCRIHRVLQQRRVHPVRCDERVSELALDWGSISKFAFPCILVSTGTYI
jgi:hypothetical protein